MIQRIIKFCVRPILFLLKPFLIWRLKRQKIKDAVKAIHIAKAHMQAQKSAHKPNPNP
jgi:hypothetical protein